MSLFSFFKNFFSKRHSSNTADSKSVFDHYFFDSKYYLHPNASIENSLAPMSKAGLSAIVK
jgi:hypothetical protein